MNTQQHAHKNRGPIHRHCPKINLKIYFKAFGEQQLKYAKIILRHALSVRFRFETWLKICHKHCVH